MPCAAMAHSTKYYSQSKRGTETVKDTGVLRVIIMAHEVMVSYVLQ
jgi:hypothetical protein